MHYAASKGGMVSLTKTIARGFAKDGILAYGIAPGFVKTEMVETGSAVFDVDWLKREFPMGAMAEPEDVANTVAFLASGLAPHMTGATLDINGASYVRCWVISDGLKIEDFVLNTQLSVWLFIKS